MTPYFLAAGGLFAEISQGVLPGRVAAEPVQGGAHARGPAPLADAGARALRSEASTAPESGLGPRLGSFAELFCFAPQTVDEDETLLAFAFALRKQAQASTSPLAAPGGAKSLPAGKGKPAALPKGRPK